VGGNKRVIRADTASVILLGGALITLLLFFPWGEGHSFRRKERKRNGKGRGGMYVVASTNSYTGEDGKKPSA